MVISSTASWRGSVVCVVAAGLLGSLLPTPSALADDLVLGRAQEIGSKSGGSPSERSGPGKAPARKPPRTPDQSGNFVYEILSNIRARSEELCARYGSPGDCLEEAEVCLTMRDGDDNQVRLCLNTVPGGSSGEEGKMQKTRLRR
jgi:hypothetical protein